jgi:hypothetical protein
MVVGKQLNAVAELWALIRSTAAFRSHAHAASTGPKIFQMRMSGVTWSNSVPPHPKEALLAAFARIVPVNLRPSTSSSALFHAQVDVAGDACLCAMPTIGTVHFRIQVYVLDHQRFGAGLSIGISWPRCRPALPHRNVTQQRFSSAEP